MIDTKLARETKGGTVLQLCLYADLVESVQGRRPEFGYVVAPWSNYVPQKFRMDDYSAFYRRVRRSLEEFVEAPGLTKNIRSRRNIAISADGKPIARRGAGPTIIFVSWPVFQSSKPTNCGARHQDGRELAAMPLPLAWKPERGPAHAYERVREQARIQVEGRKAGQVLHELLPVVPGFGLVDSARTVARGYLL